jgi:hypothetical protein
MSDATFEQVKQMIKQLPPAEVERLRAWLNTPIPRGSEPDTEPVTWGQRLAALIEKFPLEEGDQMADQEAELAALWQLSDDALWTIAAEQMPTGQQERRSILLGLNKHIALDEVDKAELDNLLERGDRLMVRKAEAARILTERGHKVAPQDLAAQHG